MLRRSSLLPALAIVATAALLSLTDGSARGASVHEGALPRATPTTTTAQAYAYYYLWWDTARWHATLGPNYPYGDVPLPLPASLDASGCNPTSTYAGNIATDVPAQLFTQSDQAQIDLDVNNAIAAGLTGFAVDWTGTGTTTQSPAASDLDLRLDMLVQAVDAAQAAGNNFHLWLAYDATDQSSSQAAMANDLGYFSEQYGSDPAFDQSNEGKRTVLLRGAGGYPDSLLAAIAAEYGPYLYLVGDFPYYRWDNTVAAYFEADSPYWSSQNPYNNPASFMHLAELAATLHSEGKKYFAPLSPGYDRQLDGSTKCVPRDNGQTLTALYNGNLSGNPDGWLVISWNQITDGTYITPQLQRYGSLYGGPDGLIHQLFAPNAG